MCWGSIIELSPLLWIRLWRFRLESLSIEYEHMSHLNISDFGTLAEIVSDPDEASDLAGLGADNLDSGL